MVRPTPLIGLTTFGVCFYAFKVNGFLGCVLRKRNVFGLISSNESYKSKTMMIARLDDA